MPAFEDALAAAEDAIRKMVDAQQVENALVDDAGRCPKAEAIVERNSFEHRHHGMNGCVEAFANALSPEAAKRIAAQRIIGLRKNRQILKNMGRDFDARLKTDLVHLDRIAEARREAFRRVRATRRSLQSDSLQLAAE